MRKMRRLVAMCLVVLLGGCASTVYRVADGVERLARDVKSQFAGTATEEISPARVRSVPEPTREYLAGRIRLECDDKRGSERRDCTKKTRLLIARETEWSMRRCGGYLRDRTSYAACLEASVPDDRAFVLPALSSACLKIYRKPFAKRADFIGCQKREIVRPIVVGSAKSVAVAKTPGRKKP